MNAENCHFIPAFQKEILTEMCYRKEANRCTRNEQKNK